MSLLHCFQLSTCQTQLANNRMFCFFTQCPNFYGIWVVQTQKHSSAVSLKNTLLTKTASTQCLFNPVFPRYTIPLTVCHMYCGADRRIEICSDHDYISPVCLPGHVLVKLWLSTTSSKERERERDTHTHTHPPTPTHTQAMSTPSSPTQPDPSIRTLLSSVVWYTLQCQLFSLSLGMWSTKVLDSPLSFHWGRFLWKDVWED